MSETANTDTTSATKPDATSESTKQTTSEEQFPDGLSDAGKAALREQREARKAAEKRNGEFAKELTALRQEKADREKAKSEQDEADAAKRGEFEQLAAKRKQEADDARAEAEAKGARLTRAETALTAFLADRIKALEAMKDADLSAEFAAITDPLDQLDWFGKASVKRAMAEAAEGKKVDDASKRTRTPGTPDTNGLSDSQAASAEQKRLAATGKYTTI
jgi:DNA repair exonuclease SbcCD ATPase subunit